MKLYHDVESELAARLEQLERGDPAGVSRETVSAEVIDLLTLAHEIRTMPPVQPDARWLSTSKRRLMDRLASAGSASWPRRGDDPGR